jgi:hypothetical protein
MELQDNKINESKLTHDLENFVKYKWKERGQQRDCKPVSELSKKNMLYEHKKWEEMASQIHLKFSFARTELWSSHNLWIRDNMVR